MRAIEVREFGEPEVLVPRELPDPARSSRSARGGRKLALARELGAEVTVDYSEGGWQHRVRAATGGEGVDVAFDGAGGPLGTAAFETVTRGGRFVTYGTASGGFTEVDPAVAAGRGIKVTNALAVSLDRPAVRELLTEALTLAASGRIRPAIGATHPLERAADAHIALEARTAAGKSLLLI